MNYFSLFYLTLFVALSSNSTFGQTGRDDSLPNLVLIVADDLGYGDLGIQGSLQIPTPNIDQIARDGIVFTNGYASSAVCAPSRAGLLTGKHQAGFGFNDNLAHNQPGFDPAFAGLPVTELTLANRLKALGYSTGAMGKWHLGTEPQFNPVKRGFDEFWGFLGGGHDYFSAKINGTEMEAAIQCNFKTPGPLTYLTNDIGNECVDYIKRHKQKPFFLYAAFNAPHAPMQALEEDLQRFSRISDLLRRTYCAMVYRMDLNVGKILQALKDQGLERNTLIVFISDNGGPSNSISNGSVNAPLRGQKTTLLEGGIRVPFFMKWPEKLRPGQKINEPVSTLNLCPTFIAAGGAVSLSDHFSGINMLPYLLNKNENIPPVTLEWKYTVGAAIREGNWKLIRLPDRLPMLYNLTEDISEQANEALQFPEITSALLKKLGTWELHLPYSVFHEPADWRIRHLGYYDAPYQLLQPE